MFVSNFISFLHQIYQVSMPQKTCYEEVPGNLGVSILVFAVIRLLTHYLLMALCLYVFWVRKDQVEPEEEVSLSPEEHLLSPNGYEKRPHQTEESLDSVMFGDYF
mmetsp:Transcript_8421/g.12436  ORF Transcript_8421/g.12436 Transcript_8421/m.12436 type:complete len:105 (-) Transcript_8421:34-348(-)